MSPEVTSIANPTFPTMSSNDTKDSVGYAGRMEKSTKMVSRAHFMGLAQSSSERIAAWSARVGEEALQCTAIGVSLTDDDKVTVLLKGLTPAYYGVRMSIYSQSSLQKTTFTFAKMKAALISTESVDSAAFETQASPSAFAAGAKSNAKPREKSIYAEQVILLADYSITNYVEVSRNQRKLSIAPTNNKKCHP